MSEPGEPSEVAGSASVSAIPAASSSSITSPTIKSSHKVHRGKGHQRLSQGITSVSALRDTLQAFGDDVIKIKDPTHLPIPQYKLDLHHQSSLDGGSVNPSFDSAELINIFSGTEGVGTRDAIKFERIPSDEVGIRSTRWKKALIAGLLSSKLSSRQSSVRESASPNELEFSEIPEADRKPPFWGVGVELRNKLSLLNLQLILHETGCFASCILLGCLIVRALEVVTSVSTKSCGGDRNASWNFSRLYGSFQSLLLIFTSLGFLIRVNTLKTSSLLTMPLMVTSVIFLASTEYLNKAWDLQRHECFSYFNLDETAKAKAHLTHDCNFWKDGYQSGSSPVLIFTSILPAIVGFLMSLFLFLFRNSYYLIDHAVR